MDQHLDTAVPEQTQRKEYRAPQLTDYGRLAEITQGSAVPSGADAGIYS